MYKHYTFYQTYFFLNIYLGTVKQKLFSVKPTSRIFMFFKTFGKKTKKTKKTKNSSLSLKLRDKFKDINCDSESITFKPFISFGWSIFPQKKNKKKMNDVFVWILDKNIKTESKIFWIQNFVVILDRAFCRTTIMVTL